MEWQEGEIQESGSPGGWVNPPGVRASIVVMKRGNARGAKGGRKVEA